MIQAAAVALLLQAQAVSGAPGPARQTVLCLDPLGINRGATCHGIDASLLGSRPDSCQCLNAGVPVAAPYCRAGEQPQAETADYLRARYAASQADGTLVGKSYRGRSFCVAP